MRAISFVGWSGAGKTTLIEKLLPRLRERGLRVGYLKSDAHRIDMDREGKDTDRIFRAGAERVAIASAGEGALRFRLERRDPDRLLRDFFPECDLVLVEGFKDSALPKIEVRRGGPPALPAGGHEAVVSDEADEARIPRFSASDVEGIADFVARRAAR
jgi:molybdopterin-guanine dinucleotide biosynthesis protein MobB